MKAERLAINTLKKDNTITIIPADKGRMTVVLDTDTYEEQMTTLLADSDMYKVLNKNPTEAKKINKVQ